MLVPTEQSEEVTKTASRKRLPFPNFCPDQQKFRFPHRSNVCLFSTSSTFILNPEKFRKTDHGNVSIFRTFALQSKSCEKRITETFAFFQLPRILTELRESCGKSITETFRFSELLLRLEKVQIFGSRKRFCFFHFCGFGRRFGVS